MSDQKAIDAQAARWSALAAKTQGQGKAAIAAAAKVTSPTPYLAPKKEDFGLRSEESALGGKSNPKFIYPTPVERIASLKENENDPTSNSYKPEIKRGYIRRLTEYYKNVSMSGGSTLANMRCNFQFNPQTISRGVQANYDMQFFFNQSPDQLAQPIPGQSTFSIELLFNREAEVATGMYRNESGILTQGNSYKDSNIATNPAAYITEPYDPKWVTEIGVLADLKILDDIIGQGIAQDLIENASSFKTVTSTSTNKDATDTASSDASAGFSSVKLGPFSSNIGNKAFLVPTPIRLLVSELFMIEGFVMSSQVVFNKFTPNMVPTQALVGLQIQALYFGFAQKNTFLSTMQTTPDPNTGTGATTPSENAANKAIVTQTQQGLDNFLEKVMWLPGSSSNKNLMDTVFTNAKNEYPFNFRADVSPSGSTFYKSATAKNKTGGGLTFSFSGTIKVKWNSYVDGASNSRSTIATSATGSWTYKTGVPPASSTSGVYLGSWGTATSPLVLTCGEQTADYEDNNTFADRLWFGKYKGNDVAWKFDRAFQNIPVPFNQDLFDVDLEITIKAVRGGQQVMLPQKIVKSFKKIKADDKFLWTLLTLSPGYKTPGGNYGSADRPRTN